MNDKKHRYYCKSVNFVFPYKTGTCVSFSQLFPDVNIAQMTREQVDDFICMLIKNHPYISGAMMFDFTIYEDNHTYHHLQFKNDNYKKQQPDLVYKINYETDIYDKEDVEQCEIEHDIDICD